MRITKCDTYVQRQIKYPKCNSQSDSIVEIYTMLTSLNTIIFNCPSISRYHPSFNENIYTGRAIFVEHNLPRVTTVRVKNEEAANPTPTIIPLLFPPVIALIPFHFLSSSVYISLLSPPFTLHFSFLTSTILPPPPKNQYGVASVYDVVAATACRLSPFNPLVSLVFPALVALST